MEMRQGYGSQQSSLQVGWSRDWGVKRRRADEEAARCNALPFGEHSGVELSSSFLTGVPPASIVKVALFACGLVDALSCII
jgi:hypothetical protein